jgi:hypothetical protein
MGYGYRLPRGSIGRPGAVLGCSAVALCLAVLVPAPAGALDDTTDQIWIDFHAHWFYRQNREIYGDGGYRWLPDSSAWQQAYIRPSMRVHHWKRIHLYLGVGFFQSFNRNLPDDLELRPWQGVRVRWPKLGPLTLSNLARLEQRIRWNTETWNTRTAMRFRYKLGTRIPLRQGRALESFYIPLSAELFADVGKDVETFFGSRSRLAVGVGHIHDETWVFEFHFITQRSRSARERAFETSDHIFGSS